MNSAPLPPPQPLPEFLWGESWGFVALAAQDLTTAFGDRPMRYRSLPKKLLPLNLGLAADLPIPGVVFHGGRQCRAIGQWLEQQQPLGINYVANDPRRSGGLVLVTGQQERWVLTTFEDEQMAQAAVLFHQRQEKAQGLHFFWLQPDDSGLVTTGVWLLQNA